MAWTTPTTRATGDLITASIWNTDVVNNLAYLHGDAGTVTLAATLDFGQTTGRLGMRTAYSSDHFLESGSASCPVGATAVTFAHAFSSAPNVVIAVVDGTSSRSAAVTVTGISTTGFTIENGNGSTVSVCWLADGLG